MPSLDLPPIPFRVAQAVRLRREPGTSGQVLGSLEKGAEIGAEPLVETADGVRWRRVVITGWVSEAYLEKPRPSS